MGTCTTPAGEQISFQVDDERGTESPGLRLFAGLRLDPFFIDLPGVKATEKLWRLAFKPKGDNILSVPEHVYKRGGRLVKATWGEQVKPDHSIGLLAPLVLLPILLLFATPTLQQGAAEHNADMFRLGLSVMLIAIGTYTQLSALVNAILALAAYRYATAWKSDVFSGDPSYAEHAFVRPKKETGPSVALAGTQSDTPPAIADDMAS